jgi:hypothetical protein
MKMDKGIKVWAVRNEDSGNGYLEELETENLFIAESQSEFDEDYTVCRGYTKIESFLYDLLQSLGVDPKVRVAVTFEKEGE